MLETERSSPRGFSRAPFALALTEFVDNVQFLDKKEEGVLWTVKRLRKAGRNDRLGNDNSEKSIERSSGNDSNVSPSIKDSTKTLLLYIEDYTIFRQLVA